MTIEIIASMEVLVFIWLDWISSTPWLIWMISFSGTAIEFNNIDCSIEVHKIINDLKFNKSPFFASGNSYL